MNNNYFGKPIVVTAVQFDGSHDKGKDIQELFPKESIELVYDYGRARLKLRILVGSRFIDANETDFVVRGALDELFIYRENLFHEMFQPITQDP